MENDNKIQENAWEGIEPKGQMLRPSEVIKKIGLSRSQVYQMIGRGDFPPFVKLSTRASAMPEAWLDAFIKQRVSKGINREDDVRGGHVIGCSDE